MDKEQVQVTDQEKVVTDQVIDKEMKEQEVKEKVIKKINNNIVRKPPPWILPTPSMSTSCYKLTMDMIDKQPPKKIQVYKKIKINKLGPI